MAVRTIDQCKRLVKEATSQLNAHHHTVPEPWLAQIAADSRSFMGFPVIMKVIWQRLNDHGKGWRHIEKGLIVLEYLLIHGSEQVIHEAKVKFAEIKTLTDFRYVERGVEVGQGIRDRTHAIMALLNDDAALQAARAHAAAR